MHLENFMWKLWTHSQIGSMCREHVEHGEWVSEYNAEKLQLMMFTHWHKICGLYIESWKVAEDKKLALYGNCVNLAETLIECTRSVQCSEMSSIYSGKSIWNRFFEWETFLLFFTMISEPNNKRPRNTISIFMFAIFQWIRNVDNLKIEMCLFRLENRKIALNESIGRTNCELYTRISGTLHWFTLTAHTKIGQYASSIICKLKMHSDQSSIVWKYHYIHIYIRILIKLTSIKYSVWNMKLLQQLYTRFFSLSARFANMWAATCFYCVRLFFVFCLLLSRFIYIFSNSFAFSTMRE